MSAQEGRGGGASPELPGQALARLASRGAEDAFEAIFARHGQDLFRFCCAMAGTRDGQQLFERATHRIVGELRRGEAPSDLETWLFERAAAEGREPGGEPAGGRAAAAGGAAAAAEARDAAAMGGAAAGGAQATATGGLAERFDALPEPQRSVLALALSGFVYDRIAGVMHVSSATVREVADEARRAIHANLPASGPHCKIVRDLLATEHPMVLSSSAVREHLATCAYCRDVKGSPARLKEALDEALPKIAWAVVAAILKEALARAAEPPPRRPLRSTRRGAVVLAALATLLLAAAAIGLLAPAVHRDDTSGILDQAQLLRPPAGLVLGGAPDLIDDDDRACDPPTVPYRGRCVERCPDGTVRDGRECEEEEPIDCCDPVVDDCGPPNALVDGRCCPRDGPLVCPTTDDCGPPNRLVDGRCCPRDGPLVCRPQPDCGPPNDLVDGRCCPRDGPVVCTPRPDCGPPNRLVDGRCCPRDGPLVCRPQSGCGPPNALVDDRCCPRDGPLVCPTTDGCDPPQVIVEGECVDPPCPACDPNPCTAGIRWPPGRGAAPHPLPPGIRSRLRALPPGLVRLTDPCLRRRQDALLGSEPGPPSPSRRDGLGAARPGADRPSRSGSGAPPDAALRASRAGVAGTRPRGSVGRGPARGGPGRGTGVKHSARDAAGGDGQAAAVGHPRGASGRGPGDNGRGGANGRGRGGAAGPGSGRGSNGGAGRGRGSGRGNGAAARGPAGGGAAGRGGPAGIAPGRGTADGGRGNGGGPGRDDDAHGRGGRAAVDLARRLQYAFLGWL
ncbi:MAG TPA: hypothetical protein VF520_02065 [Thermoleophilaceae bacterium]